MSECKFKPLEWDCEKRGCFNKKQRLKFSVFYDSLPGKNSFTDIDAITEYKGNALILEWKSAPNNIPPGQDIMFRQITKGKMLSVICVAGDAETMKATHTAAYFNGAWRDWKVTTTAELNLKIQKWVEWSKRNSRLDEAVA